MKCGCLTLFVRFAKGTRKSLKFMVPMIWREQKKHHDDYYFCITSLTGINKNNRSKWKYPNISSATRPTPRTDTISIPLFIRKFKNVTMTKWKFLKKIMVLSTMEKHRFLKLFHKVSLEILLGT